MTSSPSRPDGAPPRAVLLGRVEVGGVEVEEELGARADLGQLAGGREQDLAPRVPLVVERELAVAVGLGLVVERNLDVGDLLIAERGVEAGERPPRVGVRPVAQRVAGVERPVEVDPHDPDDPAVGVDALAVGERQRLGAGDRVVAGAAVQEVAAQAAEDDVVAAGRRRTASGRPSS